MEPMEPMELCTFCAVSCDTSPHELRRFPLRSPRLGSRHFPPAIRQDFGQRTGKEKGADLRCLKPLKPI